LLAMGIRLTSPRDPRSIKSPPKKKYVPVPDAPLLPAPLQPMRAQLRGVSERRKPIRALPGQPMDSQGEMASKDVQRSRIAKGLA
jgi:hypothetical protein